MTTYSRYRNGLLKVAVESVLSQDYTDFEFVICDDCSIDGTEGYLRDVAARDPRVRVIRNPRNVNSVSISLGRCLEHADPARRYVSWMFDDCELLPGALTVLARGMERARTDVLFGVTDVKLASGGVLKVGHGSAAELRAGVEHSSALIPNGGILIDRPLFDRVGWYDPSIVLRRSCDWDLFRRMLGPQTTLEVIPDVVMEEHGDLQPDSLRNAFTTTFDIMTKYARARDAAGLPLDLQSCLTMPQDWIPPGAWTEAEIGTMQFMFLEYFLSIADIPKALRWARRLQTRLPAPSLPLGNLRHRSEADDGAHSLMAAGAYAGMMLGLYRQVLNQAQGA